MTPIPYRLPQAHFDALATGGGDADTVALLRRGQLSKHTLLVRAVMDQAAVTAPDDHAAAHLDDAYALLSAIQRISPDTVREQLLHPNLGAWAVDCLQRLHGADDGQTSLCTHLGYLGAVAASAAIRAGSAFEITVPVRDGLAMFPTLGAARLPSSERWAVAVVRGDGARACVIPKRGPHVPIPLSPQADAPGWLPLRQLFAAADGLELQIDLDDIDPYRSQSFPSVADRLDDSQIEGWRRLITEAWTLLVSHHRPYAAALAAGLRSVVPQLSTEPGRSISATSTDAFGSIAMSPPPDPVTLALTLVHEFQHAKLSALLDLTPLYDARPGSLYYAPWRDDPRPLGGLLQGVYAFLGVTDFWRVQRHYETASKARLAQFEFARWREQTRQAVEELSASSDLTSAGKRLVSGIRAALAGWEPEQVPSALVDQARESALDHRARWRMRNLRPDPALASMLADAWLADTPVPEYADPSEIVNGGPAASVDTVRLRLWHLKTTAPEQFSRLWADEQTQADFADATAADVTYVQGDYARATQLYQKQIEADPQTDGPWVGLGLAQLRGGDAEYAAALLSRPELLRAVYEILLNEAKSVDLESLARWLDRSAVRAGKDMA
jgi:HEXXH motif-containing protein